MLSDKITSFYFLKEEKVAFNEKKNKQTNGYRNPFPNKPWFLRVCSTGLLKTLWEKEKLLVMSNFSFSHSVFLRIWGTHLHFYPI